MKVSTLKCKKRLAVLWFSGSIVLFIVLLLQSIFGHYGNKVSDAWGWLLPNIMPTLSLIIGVLIIDGFSKKKGEKVDKFFFKLSFFLSLMYIILICLSIFIQPFTRLSSLELLKLSNLWLGPFQGLVSASIGAFFVKSENK